MKKPGLTTIEIARMMAETTGEGMMSVAQSLPPQFFRAWLAGTISSVLGQLPEEYWEELSKVEPCGNDGCDCHVGIMLHATKLFTLLREDYKEKTDPDSASGNN
jgi:hypothetical protein